MISVMAVGIVSAEPLFQKNKMGDWGLMNFNLLSSSHYSFDRTGVPIAEEFNFRVHYSCKPDDPLLTELKVGTMVCVVGFLRKHRKQPYIVACRPIMQLKEENGALQEILRSLPTESLGGPVEEIE